MKELDKEKDLLLVLIAEIKKKRRNIILEKRNELKSLEFLSDKIIKANKDGVEKIKEQIKVFY